MGPEAVDGYLEECKRLGFDIVEVSSGFISIPDDDLVRLVEKVRNLGMLPKPEVGIQFVAWHPWRPDNDAVIQLEIGDSTRALSGQVSEEIACRLDGFFRVRPADDQSLADDVIPTIRGPDEVAPERLFPYFIARDGCI